MATENGKITLSHSETLGEQLESIAECLRDYRTTTIGGRSARDIGLLCTSPNINEWTKNRPFEKHDFGMGASWNMYGIQSEADRKAHAYGYYWFPSRDDEDLIPLDIYPLSLISKAIGFSGEWQRKPLSIYRVWDFDGYNHNAKNPYAYTITGADTEQIRSCSVQHRAGEDYEAGISLSDMLNPYLLDATKDWLDWRIVTIVNWDSPLGTAEKDHSCVSNSGLTIRDLDDPSKVINTEVTLPFNGTDETREYEVIWAATSNDNISGNTKGQWVFLPQSLRKIQHKASYTVKWNSESGFKFDAITNADNVVTKIVLRLKLINFLPYPIFFSGRLDIWEKGTDIAYGYKYNFLGAVEDSDIEIELPNFNGMLSFTPTLENTMLALTFNPRNGETFEYISPITHFNPKDDCVEEGEAKTKDGHTVQDFRLYTLLQ
jgi:hypothetical protein